MESPITPQEANVILQVMDRVDVKGLQSQRVMLSIAYKLSQFVEASGEAPAEVNDGDDVPSTAE